VLVARPGSVRRGPCSPSFLVDALTLAEPEPPYCGRASIAPNQMDVRCWVRQPGEFSGSTESPRILTYRYPPISTISLAMPFRRLPYSSTNVDDVALTVLSILRQFSGGDGAWRIATPGPNRAVPSASAMARPFPRTRKKYRALMPPFASGYVGGARGGRRRFPTKSALHAHHRRARLGLCNFLPSLQPIG
jgi:hypothetical protein